LGLGENSGYYHYPTVPCRLKILYYIVLHTVLASLLTAA
jgi:hypothetical protein